LSEGNGNGFGLKITPGMVIQLVTFTAMFAGSYYTMSERLDSGNQALRDLRTTVDRIDHRLDQVEREVATINVRVESVREAITELRRQSGLRTNTR
jgi:chromosome segregation ATPase